LRAALGEGPFAALWAEGEAMTLDDAVALGLRASGTSEQEGASAQPAHGGGASPE
jgi:hypothetical protein